MPLITANYYSGQSSKLRHVMAGILVGVLLVASLLLVHFSVRAQPMPRRRPLNVDGGLPWPEAGQASTVFSLTALFGAYFGIYLILGLPALLGLAFGTVVGLILIARWINQQEPASFEDLLCGLLAGSRRDIAVFGVLVAGLQCAYAASELLILRDVARAGLGLVADDATVLAISLAVIGYFYVLFGGYMAVFRTDVLQFALVGVMSVVLVLSALSSISWTGLSVAVVPRPGYWAVFQGLPSGALYAYHFALATIMGVGFLLASPDVWKRVFLVVRVKQLAHRFPVFVAVGTVPFVVLLPLAAMTPQIPDGPLAAGDLFAGLLTTNAIFVAAALGLVASFLSAFNSALLAAVHVGLMLRRTVSRVGDETARFHWLMVAALLAIGFSFLGLAANGNPYLLANVLLGVYPIVAGILVGTDWRISRLREGHLLWLTVASLSGWLFYLMSFGALTDRPITYQINTIPVAVFVFLLLAAVSRLFGIRSTT